MREIMTSVDIGSSKVCVMIAELDERGQPQIIGIGKSHCSGVKKGVVVDIEETAKSISEAVEKAESMANVSVQEVNIAIPGGYCEVIQNKGMIAVSSSNREIGEEDIERVIDAAKIISVSQNAEILDVIPREYVVDGYDEIKDPMGMTGVRLEVDADIVVGSKTTVYNLVKAVNHAELGVESIVMEPFAVAEAVLNKDEKELGVLLIDIGAGKTDISIFKNGNLMFSHLIPVGGWHISHDIKVGLRTTFEESEQLKIKHAKINSNSNSSFEINSLGELGKHTISEKDLTQIIHARIEELLVLIDNELTKKNLKKELLTGAVITGGGFNYIQGITDFSKQILGINVRLGKPEKLTAKEPIFSTAAGILQYTLKRSFAYVPNLGHNEVSRRTIGARNRNKKGFFETIKSFWNSTIK
jgi:cell division protein FtsA